MSRTLAAVFASALITLLAGCGGHQAEVTDQDAGKGFSAAADTSTCVKDATAVSSYPVGYPKDFPLPDQTVVYHVQDLGVGGVVASGVTPLPLRTCWRRSTGPPRTPVTR